MSKDAQESGTKAAEVVANSQFVSVGSSSLTFGYGRHACPGRFFAVNEIKMIMATALLHYDMKNVAGQTGRYKNRQIGAQVCRILYLCSTRLTQAVNSGPKQDHHDAEVIGHSFKFGMSLNLDCHILKLNPLY